MPKLVIAVVGTDVVLSWNGMDGVTYQLLKSQDFQSWPAEGPAMTGSNAVMTVTLPLDSSFGSTFYRLQVQ
jgi:hypothetical protein